MRPMNPTHNVIFIAIDALRARNLGCYGYERHTSPHIDSLASRGLLCENSFACTNYTDPSFTTIFSGRYPLSHGILHHGPKVTDTEVRRFEQLNIMLLPEILKENGYITLAIDWLWRWHKRGYDYYSGARGRTTLHGFIKQQLRKFPVLRKVVGQYAVNKVGEKLFGGVSKSYEDAESVTSQAIELIKENRDKRFFLFLHYWDTHCPYLPPRAYVDNYNRTKEVMEELFGYFTSTRFEEQFDAFQEAALRSEQEIVASYDGEIAFVDHEIGRLLDFLEHNRMLNDALIVLTSDHGESLLEHGIYLDHHGLYDVTLQVPLIIVHPQLPRGKRASGFVQHFDIFPTMLDLLDIKANADIDGLSILPLIDEQQLRSAVYSEEAQWQRKRAIRTEKWKYIYALSEEGALCRRCGRTHGPPEELYDLTDDPEETTNVLQREPQVAKDLRNQADRWARKFDHTHVVDDEKGETYREDMEKVEERLRRLGYI